MVSVTRPALKRTQCLSGALCARCSLYRPGPEQPVVTNADSAQLCCGHSQPALGSLGLVSSGTDTAGPFKGTCGFSFEEP